MSGNQNVQNVNEILTLKAFCILNEKGAQYSNTNKGEIPNEETLLQPYRIRPLKERKRNLL
jgi:hypothetical protein